MKENAMKKMIALLAAMLLFASVAVAAEYEGKVTEVKGNTVTVEISKGKAAEIAVGSSVKIEVDAAAPAAKPKKGMDMLQGC
jgi:hypothetical protein